ncbi:hypothetical protein PV721_24985 [Streptomyces sp. MB09-01]|nr:hypothetical protein [Streptomyces sp. MB09-01]
MPWRFVAAGDLNTGMFAKPPAQLFGIPALPERQREPRGGVNQERAVGVAVEREVVHPQHSGCDQRRQLHPHQLGEHSAPREWDVQDAQHPGATPVGQKHADGLDQVL